MDNTEKWALVPVQNNRPPSDAICWGSIGECTEFIAQSVARAEAEERITRAQEKLKSDAKTLERAQRLTVDASTRITALGDALVKAREKQARQDAAAKKAEAEAAEAAEAKRVQEMLDKLPDPDNPNAVSGDDGDLQSPKRPSDKERLNPEADGLTGSFPTRLEKEAPRGGPCQETDIKKLAYPQTPPQQPIAVSLNEV